MADIADRERAAAALDFEPDRRALDPDDFADELASSAAGPPSLPVKTLSNASCCASEVPSSRYSATRKLPASTLPGMCATIAITLPPPLRACEPFVGETVPVGGAGDAGAGLRSNASMG